MSSNARPRRFSRMYFQQSRSFGSGRSTALLHQQSTWRYPLFLKPPVVALLYVQLGHCRHIRYISVQNNFKRIPRFLLFLNPHPVGFDLATAQRHYRVGGVQSVALGIPPQSIIHGQIRSSGRSARLCNSERAPKLSSQGMDDIGDDGD